MAQYRVRRETVLIRWLFVDRSGGSEKNTQESEIVAIESAYNKSDVKPRKTCFIAVLKT